MKLKRRHFTGEFKHQVLQEVDLGKGVSQVARQYQVHPTLIHRWRQQLRHHGERAFPGNGKAHSEEAKVAALERKVGQLTMENDLLKKCCISSKIARAQPETVEAGHDLVDQPVHLSFWPRYSEQTLQSPFDQSSQLLSPTC